jgi:formylglycine-generating enzyme required for sulfatase activity
LNAVAGSQLHREDEPLDPLCRIPVWMHLPDAVSRLKRARESVPGRRWYKNLSEDDWLEPVASAVRLSRDEARALLEEGEVLLVFDGLDEIADADARLALAEVISKLPNAYGPVGTKNPVVITCREKAWGWGRGAGVRQFERIQIQPMAPATWKRYFDTWCRAVWAEDAERALQNLRKALRTSRAVQELAQNPQTATMLAFLAREGELPQERVRLYDDFLTFALANDRMERYGSADHVRDHLAALAVTLQRGTTPAGEADGLSETEARSLLGARLFPPGGPAGSEEEVRRAGELLLADLELHTGLIAVHRPEGPTSGRALVAFRHRTMQEFLVACEYASRPDEILSFERETTWLVPIVLVSGLLAKDRRDDRLKAFLSALARSGAAGPNPSPAELEQWGQRLAVLSACLEELSIWHVPPHVLAPARDAHQTIGRMLHEFDLPSRVAIVDGMGILGDPRLHPAQATRWVDIPAGSSWCGSDSDEAWIQERPRRTVNLSSYRIQRWPVTVEEFARFVEDARGYQDDQWWDEAGRLWRAKGCVEAPDGWERQRAGSNRPVTGVSWWEARAYARWLTPNETFPGPWAVTLPTEAQWERAARGPFGSPVHEAGRFPWGADWDPPNLRANCGHALDRVCPVGLFPLGNSPEDIWDLSGNVGERCLDGFGPPDPGDTTPAMQEAVDPCHFDHRFGHTVRGGDWASPVLNARVSARLPDSQSARSGRIGFRCVAWQAPDHLR